MYLVIQEGGTSAELYPHLFDSFADARDYRVSCANEGAYATTPPIKIPKYLAKALEADNKLEEAFDALLSDALDTLDDMDMVGEEDADG